MSRFWVLLDKSSSLQKVKIAFTPLHVAEDPYKSLKGRTALRFALS